MKNIIVLILALLMFPQILTAQISSGGGFSLEKSVIAAGGGESSGGAFSAKGSAGQNAAGTPSSSGAFRQIGGFWTTDQFVPTAAYVSISGSFKTAGGQGIKNVLVTLIDSSGAVRTTVTGTFGRFHFTDVEVGQTYTLAGKAKKYDFLNPTRVISVDDELTDLDFVANDL
jgi:hypothetical protein